MSRRQTAPRPITARDAAIDPGQATVACPYEPGTHIAATVNRRVDLLAVERGAGRITEAQFLVGRFCQAVWERGSGSRLGSGGWAQGSSRDQTVAHELAIRYAIGDARKVDAFNRAVVGAIGLAGLQVLRRFLVEAHTFRSYVGADAGKRQVADTAQRFRFALSELTEALHTAVGRRPLQDRHLPPVAVSDDLRTVRRVRRG
jgi:hypothetical protein